jgi:hypothetical protein
MTIERDMKMKKNEVVTIDSIIKRATKRRDDKAKPLTLYVPSLEGEMEFEKPDTVEVIELRRAIESGDIDTTEMYVRTVYNASKQLQDKELQEQLGVKDPVEVVTKVFTLAEIVALAAKILNHDDVEGDIEVVKN